MVKKILSILAWIVTAGGLIALFVAAREHYLDTPVHSVNLNIERSTDSGFVKSEAVLADIDILGGSSKSGAVNMEGIRKQLKANPWIESSSAYIGLDAVMNVSIKEYDPVLRVYGKGGQSAYLTADGILLPTSNNYTPHVLIANGNLAFDTEQLNRQLCDTLDTDRNLVNALKVFEAVQRNEFLKNRVGQIYCNAKNGFELTTKDLTAKIVVGDTCNLDDKLKRLEIFTKQKGHSAEVGKYTQIDLQYKNQIVCTKKR